MAIIFDDFAFVFFWHTGEKKSAASVQRVCKGNNTNKDQPNCTMNATLQHCNMFSVGQQPESPLTLSITVMDKILHHLQQFLLVHRFFTFFSVLIKDLKSLPTGMDITQRTSRVNLRCMGPWALHVVEPKEAPVLPAFAVRRFFLNFYCKNCGVHAAFLEGLKAACIHATTTLPI